MAHLGPVDNQETEVTQVLMVPKVRLDVQVLAATLVPQVRLDRLVHPDPLADRDLLVHQVVLAHKAHQEITDRLETLDKLDPREVQVEPGALDGPDKLDVMDTLERQEQRGL